MDVRMPGSLLAIQKTARLSFFFKRDRIGRHALAQGFCRVLERTV
jgi:hypothetical protein